MPQTTESAGQAKYRETIEMTQEEVDYLTAYGAPLGMSAEEVLKALALNFISRGVYPPKLVAGDSDSRKAS